jgi:hypothetical protein
MSEPKIAHGVRVHVEFEARVHLRGVLTDALAALTALDAGDFDGADTSLRKAMVAAADSRAALQVALQPPPSPKAEVDRALQEWTS